MVLSIFSHGSFLRIKIGLAGPPGVHDPSLKGPYVTGSDDKFIFSELSSSDNILNQNFEANIFTRLEF